MLNIFNRNKKSKYSTVIFLDIDNTISPNQIESDNKEYFSSDYNGSHLIAKELFIFFNDLPADIVWLTSWQSDAETTFNQGWKHLKWNDQYSYFEWKYYAAEEFLQKKENKNYTKIVWIDDDYNEWKHLTQKLTQTILPIVPEKSKGITYKDLNRINDFIDNS